MIKTNVFDRNGIELEIGDIISINRAGRYYESHYGDNIPTPSGDYVAKLEPFIKKVFFMAIFYKGSIQLVPPRCPASNYDEFACDLRMMLSRPENTHDLMLEFDTRTIEDWREDEDSDLYYILSEYGFGSEIEIAQHISGFEITKQGVAQHELLPWTPACNTYKVIEIGEHVGDNREMPF